MKQEEKTSEFSKLTPKEMHGNGLDAEHEKINFEKYIREFESAL